MKILEHKYSKNKYIKFLQKAKVWPWRVYTYEVGGVFGTIELYSKKRINAEDIDDAVSYIIHRINKGGKGELFLDKLELFINYNYIKKESWVN